MERVLGMKVTIEVQSNKADYVELVERAEAETLDEYIERIAESLRRHEEDR